MISLKSLMWNITINRIWLISDSDDIWTSYLCLRLSKLEEKSEKTWEFTIALKGRIDDQVQCMWLSSLCPVQGTQLTDVLTCPLGLEPSIEGCLFLSHNRQQKSSCNPADKHLSDKIWQGFSPFARTVRLKCLWALLLEGDQICWPVQ